MRILYQSTMFKKKNYIVKFSTSSIFKKISKDNFETNFFFKKRRRNQFWVKNKSKKKTCKKKQKKKKNLL